MAGACGDGAVHGQRGNTLAQGHLLRAAPAAPMIHIDRLTDGGPVLVLTPHPDDESLGCGAAIAAASRRGVAVTVAVVTDGRGSHPDAPGFPPERLVALRLRELRKAVATLTGSRLRAPARVVALGERDQGIPSVMRRHRHCTTASAS
ncbi:PIG-L deacetylase family protein [Tistrella bauzanensis]